MNYLQMLKFNFRMVVVHMHHYCEKNKEKKINDEKERPMRGKLGNERDP